MSPLEKWIGICGNGALGVAFFLVNFVALKKGQVPVAVFAVAVCVLAAYNIYIIDITVRLGSEEEWLKAEVRKAELRRQLAGLGVFASVPGATAEPPEAPSGVSG